MRQKKSTLLLLTVALALTALFIYACGGGGGSTSTTVTGGPQIDATPTMFSTTQAEAEAEVEEEVADIMASVGSGAFFDDAGFTEILGGFDTGGIVSGAPALKRVAAALKSGDISNLRKEALFPAVLPGCPTITVTDIPQNATAFPSPFIIKMDYGSGCAPFGTSATVSGSLTFTLTGITLGQSGSGFVVSGNYSLVADNLNSGAGYLNGSITGNFSVSGSETATTENTNVSMSATFNSFTNGVTTTSGSVSLRGTNLYKNYTTKDESGTLTLTFTGFTNGTDSLNGTFAQSYSIAGATGLSTTTLTFTTFTDGNDSLHGTMSFEEESSTSVVYDIDMGTSEGDVDMNVRIVADEATGTETLNTIGDDNTYHGLSVTYTDIVVSDTCALEPTSGTMILSDGTVTATIVFEGVCDGNLTDITLEGVSL